MKKVLSVLLAAALSVAVFASCGATPATSTPATSTPAASTPAKTEGVKLVYWPMWAETEPQGIVIAKAAEAFTKETGIEMDINWAGSRDTRKTLEPALGAKQEIDIFDEDIERVNTTWGKYILDIDEMYTASALNGKQNATLINLAKELGGGKIKSVPFQPSTFQVQYNKNAFTLAGVTAVPKTWDELMAACEKLKAAKIVPFTLDDAYMAAFFGYVMDRCVGDTTTKAVANGDFTNAAVLETAKVIEDMIKKGYIDPRAAGNVYPAGQAHIGDGSVAMYLNGTWLPNEIKNQTTAPDFKWGQFALPQCKPAGDGIEANQFGAQCFAINKDSKNPEAAFKFIEFMTSGEWDQTLATETLGVPMSNDAKWPESLADAKGCLDQTTKRLTWAVDMEVDANVNACIKENIQKMLTGKTTAENFAKAFGAIKKAA